MQKKYIVDLSVGPLAIKGSIEVVEEGEPKEMASPRSIKPPDSEISKFLKGAVLGKPFSDEGESCTPAELRVFKTEEEASERIKQEIEPKGVGPAIKVVYDANEDPDNQPVEPPTSIGVDSAGTPWDHRIHSSSKKTTAKGIWKKKRNVNEMVFNKVMAEITAQVPPIAKSFAKVTDVGNMPADIVVPVSDATFTAPQTPPPPPPPQNVESTVPADAPPMEMFLALSKLINDGTVTEDDILQVGKVSYFTELLEKVDSLTTVYQTFCK